jgi:hypothetical protein
MMKCVVLAGSAVRIATSGVETQRAAWNADANSSIDRIMFVLLWEKPFLAHISICALGAHGNSGYNYLLEVKAPIVRVNY